MGDFDLVKVVLDELADMRWMQIAIRPAKPFAFGVLDGTPVFGLPGNPVSSLVSLALLGVPGLRRLAGRADTRPAPGAPRSPAPALCRAGPTAGPPTCGSPAAGPTAALHGRAGRRPRARTSWRRPPTPTAWPCSPTATASPPGDDVTVVLLAPSAADPPEGVGGRAAVAWPGDRS